MPIPIAPRIAITTTKIITANIAIAKAFIQLQSKKCFTKLSNNTNKIIDAMIPSNSPLKTVLITGAQNHNPDGIYELGVFFSGKYSSR